ncbi:MAG TPA: glucuronate isomerase, partial [bacterium]
MKTPTFIHEDFLLENRAGRRLFHEYAEALPIVDYHSHLPSREIAEDRRFKNLTQV